MMTDTLKARKWMPEPSYHSLWKGVAWSAVFVLFASSLSRALRLDSLSLSFSSQNASDYLPPLFFACVLLLHSRFKRTSLSVGISTALFCFIMILKAYPWGDGMTDASALSQRHYYAITFLSDALIALGSAIFLVANFALIYTDRRSLTER